MNGLNKNILKWAEERGINNPNAQLIKAVEEFGELCFGINYYKNVKEYNKVSRMGEAGNVLADAIGDTYVTLLIEANLLGYKFKAKKNDDIYEDDDAMTLAIYAAMRLGDLAKNIAHDREIYFYEETFSDLCTLLNVIAKKSDMKLKDCVNLAYNEIKDRKGKTVDGNFIKEQ